MRTLSICLVLLALIGCSKRAWIIPPSDPSLRKTAAQFKADAAKRHPYKVDAPRGGEAVSRAEVDYASNKISLANLSKDGWDDVEIWVNNGYVVHLPKMEPGKLKVINFAMLFDASGKTFPENNKKTLVEKVEVLHGGKIYDVPVKLAD
jgi:hypothetical protein